MLESINSNRKGIALMLLSSICACTGQLLWKIAGSNGILCLLAGFSLYGIGALLMIIAYRYGKLSVLQPMLAMNYVLGVILGKFILDESISPLKIGGTLVIMIGVLMIAGGDKQ